MVARRWIPTRRVAPWLVLAVGAATTVGVFAYREDSARRQDMTRIETETDAAMEQYAATLDGYEAVVRGDVAFDRDVFPGLIARESTAAEDNASLPPELDSALDTARERMETPTASEPFLMTGRDGHEVNAFAVVLASPDGEVDAVLVDLDQYLTAAGGDVGDGYRIELFADDKMQRDALITTAHTTADPLGRTRVMPLTVWDREWTVRFTERNPAADGSTWVAILVGGGLATIALFLLVFFMDRAEVRARRLVAEATRELSRQEQHFRALVANSSDLVSVVDADGRFTYVSPAVTRLLGYSEEELLGSEVAALVHPDDAPLMHHALGALAAPGEGDDDDESQFVARVRHADGTWRHLESAAANLLDDPAVGGVVLNSRDVTERVAFQEHLESQATHDALTGLPNRTLLLGRLSDALGRSRSRGQTAVLFVDLDRFKLVNDSLGHRAGDQLLVAVSERLQRAVRPGDVVARFGGDEFVVLAEGVVDEDECRHIANRLAEQLRAPFRIDDQEVFVTASVGMTIANPEADTPDTLLRDADAAMYQAKGEGRARSVLFEEQVHQRTVDRLAEEAALHRALERDELVVQYQPQVDIATGDVVGVEALLAWQHPERGLLGPDQFLTVAEDTGLIVPFGAWVMRQACRDTYRWLKRFGRPLRVSVNVSARQLVDAELTDLVRDVLAESGLPSDALCVEVAESVLTDERDIAVPLHALRALGVRVAIDDFGTGFASLAHLKRFPVDQLKIDAAFVAGLGHDADDTVIVAAVIGLAHALGVVALAEGVEQVSQLEELRALRCDLAQGYLFARPGDAASIDALLGAVAPTS